MARDILNHVSLFGSLHDDEPTNTTSQNDSEKTVVKEDEVKEVEEKNQVKPIKEKKKIEKDNHPVPNKESIKKSVKKTSENSEEFIQLNIRLPKSVFEMLQVCKRGYNDNQTTFFRNMIIKDFEENAETYKKMPIIR